MARPGGLIDNIKKELMLKGMPTKMREARGWLMGKLPGLSVTPKSIVKFSPGRASGGPLIGRMYFYFYDAKTKDKLPYWDKFPLVLPIEQYDDGFLGLNLHYLDYESRALLLDNLMTYRNNDKNDESTYLQLSYRMLSGIKKWKKAQHCIKRYLYGHIQSSFIEVYSDEWNIAIFLPVERFKKASKYTVWADTGE